MKIEQIKEVFEGYGYNELFENIGYPLIMSRELDNIQPDVLEQFFHFFDMEEVSSFEEFIYYFLVFKKIYKNNRLPFIDKCSS